MEYITHEDSCVQFKYDSGWNLDSNMQGDTIATYILQSREFSIFTIEVLCEDWSDSTRFSMATNHTPEQWRKTTDANYHYGSRMGISSVSKSVKGSHMIFEFLAKVEDEYIHIYLSKDKHFDPHQYEWILESFKLKGLRGYEGHEITSCDEEKLAWVIRTCFDKSEAWDALLQDITSPPSLFNYHLQIIQDRKFDNCSQTQVIRELSDNYDYSFVFIADDYSLSHDGFPLLVMNLEGKRGSAFRVVAKLAAGIENNLSNSNMEFNELKALSGRDRLIKEIL